jgi:hypothetical protein
MGTGSRSAAKNLVNLRNCRGLSHFAESSEQNGTVPLAQIGAIYVGDCPLLLIGGCHHAGRQAGRPSSY